MFFSGCASLVSPYSTTFQCPDGDKGKCVSVKTAYKESVEENPLVRDESSCEECEKDKGKKEEPPAPPPIPVKQGQKADYQDAMYRKLSTLIGQPTPPIVAPPQVMRVLILSYTGSENEMFGYRYVYFFATDPKWIFSTETDGD